MPERQGLEEKLAKTWPPTAWRGVRVLAAVSGGPDSTALLRALCALNDGGPGRIAVAHFNHRLRGQESDADAAFVADMAVRLRCPYEVGYPPEAMIRPAGGDGLEAAARRARYQFLTQTAARLGARYVAVAHTADDQAETILHRILRGTGIGGLAGIRRARPLSEATTVIRPFLEFRRAEIHAYLEQLGQPYRLDATNLDSRRTRNRIRHRLLPTLAAEYNPDVIGALFRLGSLAGEVQSLVGEIVERLVERSLTLSEAVEARLRLSPLQGESRYVLREVLMAIWRRQGWPRRHMGFEEWDRLAAMVDGRGERGEGRGAKEDMVRLWRSTLPGGILAEVNQETLRLRRT